MTSVYRYLQHNVYFYHLKLRMFASSRYRVYVYYPTPELLIFFFVPFLFFNVSKDVIRLCGVSLDLTARYLLSGVKNYVSSTRFAWYHDNHKSNLFIDSPFLIL